MKIPSIRTSNETGTLMPCSATEGCATPPGPEVSINSSYFSLVCKTRSFMKKRRKRIIFGDKLLLIVEVVDLSDEDGAICIRNKCSLQAVKCGSYSCSDRLRGAAASNVAYKCGLTA